jgi:uncharacterized membrane protein
MDDKTKGILAYIFGIIAGTIFLFSKESTQIVKQHSANGFVTNVMTIILYILFSFNIRTWMLLPLVWAFAIAILVIGIVKVCNNSDPNIPVISDIAKAIFKNQLSEQEEK